MKPMVPTRTRVLASLAPVLFLLAVTASVFFFKNTRQLARLTRERKAAVLALPHLEQAREILERTERYLRLAAHDDFRRGETRDFVQLSLDATERALKFDGASEEGFRLQGRALELAYNFDEARESYAKAIEQHPESPARYHLGLLGTRLLARARLAEFKLADVSAETLASRASEPLRRFQAVNDVYKFATDRKLVYMCTVCVAYALGDYSAVSTAARAAREWDATEWLPSYLEGVAAWELKRPADAVKAFEEAVRLAPAVADPHAWLGAALHAVGRRTEAVAALSTALQASEHFLEAYYVRGQILFEDGRYADALADFSACARLRPSLAEVQLRLGVSALEHWNRSGRREAALLETAAAALTAAVDADPREPRRRLLRARAWAGLGKAEAAEKDLAEAVALSPGALDVLLLRAELHEGAGRWAEAEKELSAALEKAEPARRAELLRRRAAARARAGRVEEALGDFDVLLETDPNDAGAHLDKARLLAGAKRFDEALAAVNKAPLSARSALARAEILLEKGESAAARAEADFALKADPELAEAYVARGRAALAAGDKAAAREDFTRAVEKRPDLKAAVEPLLKQAD